MVKCSGHLSALSGIGLGYLRCWAGGLWYSERILGVRPLKYEFIFRRLGVDGHSLGITALFRKPRPSKKYRLVLSYFHGSDTWTPIRSRRLRVCLVT